MEKEVFANYNIVARLGVGSTASVFHAKSDGKEVALKVFFSQGPAARIEQLRKVFEQELDSLRLLNHPHIVKLFDSGVHDGKPYLAIELMKGGNLYDRLNRVDFLPVEDVVSLVKSLADALDYAHGVNLLHRDIKPSNILFDDAGRAVLSDFGIARFVRPREDATAIEGQMGTADFMAPEVLEDAPASKVSDIYSLGICTYYMLANHLPSEGVTTFSRCKNRALGKLIPLCERNPNIDVPISECVMRSIATNPKKRYRSAGHFADALALAAAGEPTGLAEKPASKKAAKESNGKLDYWRYVIVPIIVALLGLLGTVLVKLLK